MFHNPLQIEFMNSHTAFKMGNQYMILSYGERGQKY